ncbi:hypothetical protein [Bradyrhizobium sp. JYMT SZCCT0428]|uniref:hypothetical protein n=1 Tax=Bradyrhizobium sp. JYMT SZCCT0428 TaxID=2807673 RepID=UPI001BAD2D31|nr:hypothetical protein [Bradyrhizobium sp. JYMT SZCCT0428]MBR1153574.1 hypothetical protein [Bradyrhizobium sp. JYMT SZCCT0428]
MPARMPQSRGQGSLNEMRETSSGVSIGSQHAAFYHPVDLPRIIQTQEDRVKVRCPVFAQKPYATSPRKLEVAQLASAFKKSLAVTSGGLLGATRAQALSCVRSRSMHWATTAERACGRPVESANDDVQSLALRKRFDLAVWVHAKAGLLKAGRLLTLLFRHLHFLHGGVHLQ